MTLSVRKGHSCKPFQVRYFVYVARRAVLLHLQSFCLVTSPFKRVQTIVMSLSVCVSVCLSAGISRKPRGRIRQYFVYVYRGRGSPSSGSYCDTLCTSGFVDDAMFSYNGLTARHVYS